MLELWDRVVIGSAIAVYLAGLACAGGVLLEGLRVDERLSGALGTPVVMDAPWRAVAIGDRGSLVAAGEAGR
jgi:hypothetical protein